MAARPGRGVRVDSEAQGSTYARLAQVTTGRAAADLAAYLDATATQEIRQSRENLEASTLRAVAAARAAAEAARASGRATTGASRAEATSSAASMAMPQDGAERPRVEATRRFAVEKAVSGTAEAATSATGHAVASHEAARLLELAAYRNTLVLSRGTRGPDAPLRNVIR